MELEKLFDFAHTLTKSAKTADIVNKLPPNMGKQ